MVFQTEFDFVLPRGYADATGMLHRDGKMRLATAADEILPLRDPRVVQNNEYLPIILFARVITRLGSLPAVDTQIVEKLFIMDMAFLQDMYNKINHMDIPAIQTTCPKCGEGINVPVNFTTAGQ